MKIIMKKINITVHQLIICFMYLCQIMRNTYNMLNKNNNTLIETVTKTIFYMIVLCILCILIGTFWSNLNLFTDSFGE